MTESRHRERPGEVTTQDFDSRCWYNGTAGSCSAGPGPMSSYIEHIIGGHSLVTNTSWMDDIVTPDYKKLSAAGKIINNPMTKEIVVAESKLIDMDIEIDIQQFGCSPPRWYPYRTFHRSGTKPLHHVMPDQLVFLPIDPPNWEDLADKAIIQAWSNVDHTEILSLSAMKEAGSTIAGLSDILRKVCKIGRAVRRREIKIFLRGQDIPKKRKKNSLSKDDLITIQDLEELYMNARYNLRPLYHDVKALLKILKEKSVDKPGRQTFRGFASEMVSDSDTVSAEVEKYSIYWDTFADVNRSTMCEVEVRAGVLTESETVSNAQIWGLDSIVAAAWDLTPYSFIIDWFWNVGDTIMAWTPNVGIKHLASWVTVKTTTTQKATMSDASVTTIRDDQGLQFTPSGGITGGSESIVTQRYERIPGYSRPFLPSWNIKMDALKLFDLGIIMKNLAKYRKLSG